MGCCIIDGMKKIVIEENECNQRLDKFLRKFLNTAPLSFIYKTIRKDVKINGKRKKNDYILKLGDVITLYIKDDDIEKLHKEKKNLEANPNFKIVYEDDNIIIPSKPVGILTHGDRMEKKNHLANQIITYLVRKGEFNPEREKTFSPSPVNRLDRNTSGLVIFCKNYKTLQTFNKYIRERNKIRKFYITIVYGELKEELHLINSMVKDEERNMINVIDNSKIIDISEGHIGESQIYNRNLKTMETKVKPIKIQNGYTLVEVEIITGRTHQIRGQLAHEGYPLIGDTKYGNKKVNYVIKKDFGQTVQLLHSWKIKFGKLEEDFQYLSGKVIESNPPRKFMEIERSIFY